jgi:predicted ester cyclase
VVEEGTFSGTHNGVFHSPMGDVPPTGRSVSAEYVQVLRYRDGLCVSGNLMFDRMELLDQLGLLPAPATAG